VRLQVSSRGLLLQRLMWSEVFLLVLPRRDFGIVRMLNRHSCEAPRTRPCAYDIVVRARMSITALSNILAYSEQVLGCLSLKPTRGRSISHSLGEGVFRPMCLLSCHPLCPSKEHVCCVFKTCLSPSFTHYQLN
jgi:hypothetical protein